MALLCKDQNDGTKKGFFENKHHEEKDDSHCIELVYDADGVCFVAKSKEGKEWTYKITDSDNVLECEECPCDGLKLVEIMKEGDTVTGLKGTNEELWSLVDAWSA